MGRKQTRRRSKKRKGGLPDFMNKLLGFQSASQNTAPSVSSNWLSWFSSGSVDPTSAPPSSAPLSSAPLSSVPSTSTTPPTPPSTPASGGRRTRHRRKNRNK